MAFAVTLAASMCSSPKVIIARWQMPRCFFLCLIFQSIGELLCPCLVPLAAIVPRYTFRLGLQICIPCERKLQGLDLKSRHYTTVNEANFSFASGRGLREPALIAGKNVVLRFISCSSFDKMDSAKGSYKISANASLSVFNTVFGLAPFEVSGTRGKTDEERKK